MVKKIDHDHDTLDLPMVNGQNWPILAIWPWYLILKFRPWSWSKMTNFDHFTPSCAIRCRIAIRELWIREFIFWLWRIAIFIISNLEQICRQYGWNPDKIESITPQLHCKHHKWLHLLLIYSILPIRTKFMFWDIKYCEKSKFTEMPNCCRIFLQNPDSRIFSRFSDELHK